jgi:hypothetical protein
MENQQGAHVPRRNTSPVQHTEKVIYHAWTDVDGVDDLPPLRMIEQDGRHTVDLKRNLGLQIDRESVRYFRTTVVTTVKSVEVNHKGEAIGNGKRPYPGKSPVTGHRPYPNVPNRLI